jgi:hypothetical protein
MSNRILIFYGSYRSDRMGIRLAEFVVERLRRCAAAVDYGHSPIERCPPSAAKIGLTHLMAASV